MLSRIFAFFIMATSSLSAWGSPCSSLVGIMGNYDKMSGLYSSTIYTEMKFEIDPANSNLVVTYNSDMGPYAYVETYISDGNFHSIPGSDIEYTASCYSHEITSNISITKWRRSKIISAEHFVFFPGQNRMDLCYRSKPSTLEPDATEQFYKK